jgi:hypothetical protein
MEIIVDNGKFDDIKRLSARFAKPIARGQKDVATLEARLQRTVVWRDLSHAAAYRRVRLASALAAAAATAEGMPLQKQLELEPSAVIGAEDLTAALWLSAGLDTPALPGRRTELLRRNQAVANRGKLAISSLPRHNSPEYLAVASAVDYDTAYDAGKVFAGAGLTGAAMGFGAFMADDSFTDRIELKGRTHALPNRLPMRYVRTALVARGFWDGWRASTRNMPRRFHFLGLGAPIMIPLVAVAGYGTPLLTFDATSPIRDAVEGTLYSARGAYLKLRTRKIAELLTSGKVLSWTCACPFCKSFVRKYPFDYVRGRKWGKGRTTSSPITAEHFQPSGALYRAYPLLAEPKGGELRKAVSFTRAGHNHWVLLEITRDLRKHGQSRSSIEAHVQRIVSDYKKSTSASYFADAVALAFDLATGQFPS